MNKQLILLVLLPILAYSQCDQPITHINAYSFTLIASGSNNFFPLSIYIPSSASTALAIHNIQGVKIVEWNLTLTRSTSALVFKSQYGWKIISCIVWLVEHSEIVAGQYTVQFFQPLMITTDQQLPIIQQIQYEQQSVALVFINGLSSNSTVGVSLLPYRVFNQSICLTIQITRGSLNKLTLSYLVFSPSRASFQAYGNVLPFNSQPQPQRMNLLDSGVFDSQFKIYGLNGVDSQPEMNIQATIDKNYLIEVDSKKGTWWLTYLIVTSRDNNCLPCPDNHCQGQCQKGDTLQIGKIQSCGLCAEWYSYQQGTCSIQESKQVQVTAQLYAVNNNPVFLPFYIIQAAKSQSQSVQSIQNTKVSLGSSQNSSQPTNSTTVQDITVQNQTIFNTTVQNITDENDNQTVATWQQVNEFNETQSNRTNGTIELANSTEGQQKQIGNQTIVGATVNQSHSQNINKNQTIPMIISTLSPLASNNTTPTTNTSSYTAANMTNIATSSTVKPPVITVAAVSSTINSTPALNCTINSIAMGGRCVCKLGYVNISSHCIPLASMTLMTIDPAKTIKGSTACSSNQIYSSTQAKCICQQGYTMTNNQCVNACGSNERYNSSTKKCLCMANYARIQGICRLCTIQGPYSGSQVCYPILSAPTCRENYVLTGQYCVNCPNNSCSCESGFIYNGSQCQCPQYALIVASTCISTLCGNGILNTNETCDDGNQINNDGCSSLCLTQTGYICSVGQPCHKVVCGDGVISGGELCDDRNNINYDGCSSSCILEPKSTCLGTPSICFNIPSANLTVVSVNINANNVYLILQTPFAPRFANPMMTHSFIKVNFLNSATRATPYCQQEAGSLDRFECLLIYPSGTPVTRQFVEFTYADIMGSGRSIVEISGASWTPTAARRMK